MIQETPLLWVLVTISVSCRLVARLIGCDEDRRFATAIDSQSRSRSSISGRSRLGSSVCRLEVWPRPDCCCEALSRCRPDALADASVLLLLPPVIRLPMVLKMRPKGKPPKLPGIELPPSIGGERAVPGEMGEVGVSPGGPALAEAAVAAPSPGPRGGSGCSTSWYRQTAVGSTQLNPQLDRLGLTTCSAPLEPWFNAVLVEQMMARKATEYPLAL